MTPAQFAELQTAWPGDWQRADGHPSVAKYELRPIRGKWTPGASIVPWTGEAVLVLRQDGHKTLVGSGATFTAAVEKLRAKLDKYMAELRSLAAELPTPRARMTAAQLVELHAAWPGPWRRVADQDDGDDDYDLPPNADGWDARAGVVPSDGATVCMLILRRGDHEALAWTAETFAACAKAIRAKLDKLDAEGPQ